MPVMITAASINQCGTKITGLDSPDILSKDALLLLNALVTEITKGIPKSNPKPVNRQAPSSPTRNARKAIKKPNKVQLHEIMITAHLTMTTPSVFQFQVIGYIR